MNNDANLGTQLTIIAAGNKDQTTCCILGVRDVKFFSFSYIIYTLYYMIGVKQTLLQFRKPRKTINFRAIQKWQSIEMGLTHKEVKCVIWRLCSVTNAHSYGIPLGYVRLTLVYRMDRPELGRWVLVPDRYWEPDVEKLTLQLQLVMNNSDYLLQEIAIQ